MASLPSNLYWIKRQLEAERYNLKEISKYEKEILKMYRDTEKIIKQEIKDYYQGFADATGMTLTQAKRYLKKTELIDFNNQMELAIKTMEKNNVDPQIIGQYEKYYKRLNISRLEALQAETRAEIDILYSKLHKSMGDFLKDNIKENMQRQKKVYDETLGFDISFAGFDSKQIDKIMSIKWVDGENWSDRIWKQKDKLQNKVTTVIQQGTILGKPEREMSNQVMDAFGVKYHEAQRLVRTEQNYVINQAQKDVYSEIGVDMYEFVAMHPRGFQGSPICTELDGQEIETKNAIVGSNYPPIHPNCRSLTIPVITDENLKAIAQEKYRKVKGAKK